MFYLWMFFYLNFLEMNLNSTERLRRLEEVRNVPFLLTFVN